MFVTVTETGLSLGIFLVGLTTSPPTGNNVVSLGSLHEKSLEPTCLSVVVLVGVSLCDAQTPSTPG